MASSWDSYYVVFLSAILSLCIPLFVGGVSLLLLPRKSKKSSIAPHLRGGRPNQTVLGQRMNVRFFLAANAALVLIALALELIPCVTTLQTENREGLIKGLISIITIAGFAVLGLLYAVRKGDMGWISTFHSDESKIDESLENQKKGSQV
jgi:NADH:ubiquinone oxidoreductase subunit 3 (subunit A)